MVKSPDDILRGRRQPGEAVAARQHDQALNAAEAGMLRRGGPIPLIGLLTAVTRWIEQRHLDQLAEAGFPEIRRAHTPVVVNLPAEGIRLTDLARAAGVSKQAMAELVADLEAHGYLERRADPTDGRAKLLVMTDRARAAHAATLRIFAAIEAELVAAIGSPALEHVRDTLGDILRSVILDGEQQGP
jgi:DNA-binding MarR family transcriptional regulator